MQDNFSDNFWAEIEKRKITRVPKLFFGLKEFALKSTVVLGTLFTGGAVSVIIFLLFSRDPELDGDYSILLFRSSFFSSLADDMPYIWIGAAFVATLVSFFAIRGFKKSYLSSKLQLLFLLLITTGMLAIGFDALDVGRRAHRLLIDHVPFYFHLINAEEAHWSKPEIGRLGGRILVNLGGEHMLVVQDYHKELWRIDVNSARVIPWTPLVTGEYLKMTGEKTGEHEFRANMVIDREIPFHQR